MTCGQCNGDAEYALCWDCLGHLGDLCVSLKSVIDEIQVNVTRQSVGAPSVGSSEGHKWVLPFDLDASHVADTVYDTLELWYQPEDRTYEHIDRTSKGCHRLADWHIREYVRMGRLDTGPQMLGDFDRALGEALRVIDRKEAAIWLGDCDCGRPIYALPSKKTTLCPCGKVWDVAAARALMRAHGVECLVSARGAEKIGEVFGHTVKQSTIRVWHHRGKLSCRLATCTEGCEHVYRFGDILDLYAK